MTGTHTGSCVCGAVRFEVKGALASPDACHCVQCRKFSGHFFVSTDVRPKSALAVQGADKITWYKSSDRARRGFCSVCGASLFWEPLAHDFMGIAMGAFDEPTDTHIALHIFVAEKGDYYEIADGLPQHQRAPVHS
jgi:hypothetical protein